MAAQVGHGQGLRRDIVGHKSRDAVFGRWRFDIADLGHNLLDAGYVQLVVEFVNGFVSRLLAKTYIPAVGKSVVVISPLLLMNVDADIVDEAVRGASCICRPVPSCLRLQEVEHVLQRDAPVAVEVDELHFLEY